jgi:hypothetical protein
MEIGVMLDPILLLTILLPLAVVEGAQELKQEVLEVQEEDRLGPL